MKHLYYFLRVTLFVIGIAPFCVNAQVTVNAGLPPGGMVQKEQLWNLTIVNNTKDLMEISIKLTLQDASSGQVLMSANTGSLLLGKGIKVINNSDIQPVMYNYYTADFPGNYLPMGAYIACYGVYHMRGESEEPISDECIRFNIDPLSPPLLNTPGNKDSLQTAYPLFTWTPPAPLNMFSDLNYDIIIAEILDGQSSGEAIENNTPVYASSDLTRPIVNYPASFTKLETGKTYAWQVIAKNAFSYAAKTDVWTFTIGQTPEPVITPENNSYLLLENDLKDTYVIAGKQVKIKYISPDREHESPILFSDVHGNKVFTIKEKIAQGDNYFTIDVSNHFQTGIIYHVTITDMSGKAQAVQFQIK